MLPEFNLFNDISFQTLCASLQGGDLRYCQKCSHYKPPRAHHCRVCKRCILRMVLIDTDFFRPFYTLCFSVSYAHVSYVFYAGPSLHLD